ncbi:hypothetical protein N9223_00680 [bacterium]|nr:hypothetical protein [bacterium]
MRRILLFVGIGIGLLIIANESKAQKSVSMYGKVTTVSGDKYTGAIRWGTDNSQKAEVFWVGLFNGTKTSNDFLRFLTKSEVQELSGKEEGDALYGTVAFYGGEYTGFIQWDHDERLSEDILDGDTRGGDVKIEFGKLSSIERDRGGSNIVTKSGREMYLRGSNDVNSGNRGIIVTTDFGRVDIPWNEFKKVTFSDAPSRAIAYSTFSDMKTLSGTVTTTNGKTLSGNIIYDLDETYTFEMLQGKDDDVEYIISMGNIKSISPKNYDSSTVVLKNGTELLLGDARDVNEDNDGVLVFTGGGDPEYIRWEDIQNITFN